MILFEIVCWLAFGLFAGLMYAYLGDARPPDKVALPAAMIGALVGGLVFRLLPLPLGISGFDVFGLVGSVIGAGLAIFALWRSTGHRWHWRRPRAGPI